MPIATLDEIRRRVGEEVGVSSWLVVDQARIGAFADATEDRQFIHLELRKPPPGRHSAAPSPTVF